MYSKTAFILRDTITKTLTVKENEVRKYPFGPGVKTTWVDDEGRVMYSVVYSGKPFYEEIIVLSPEKQAKVWAERVADTDIITIFDIKV